MAGYPTVRLKRMRQTSELRSLCAKDFPSAAKFVWPIFICEGHGVVSPIKSLPGQFYYSVDKVASAVEDVVRIGVKSVIVFGMVDESKKTITGEYSFNDEGPVQRAVKCLRKEFTNLNVFVDTGLSGYTRNGHAGIVTEEGKIDNEGTLDVIEMVALSQASCGATCVSPSGMLDGQVARLRGALDDNGFSHVLIMSYALKFHSNFYRTFPYAIEKPRDFDPVTQTYLAPYDDPLQALREVKEDEIEGADIVIVKPSLMYLDVIGKVKADVKLPLAGYNVSGEYSMIHAYAKCSGCDVYSLARESLTAIFRAGADVIISYWANQYDKL